MHGVGRWILSFLYLGHLIDGVNHDALSSILINTPIYSEKSDKSSERILKHYHKLTETTEERDLHVRGYMPSFPFPRNHRSISSGLPLTQILCSPLDSCVSRCGQEPKGLIYSCNCDYLCPLFSDCCIDYEDHCEFNNSETNLEYSVPLSTIGCDILFRKYTILTINQCPITYKDVFTIHLCSVSMPKNCLFLDDHNASDVDHVYTRCKESVYRSCTAKMRLKCNEAVEPQCASTISRRCNAQAFSICSKCNIKFWPVFDSNGFIYKNSYCALCNSQRDYTILSPYILSLKLKQVNQSHASVELPHLNARLCALAAINNCSKQLAKSEMQNLCYNHSGAVETKTKLLYKNIHCALCNGEKTENLMCASRASLMRGLIRPMLETFVTGDVQGMQLDDIPAAFSILLNFGLDGRERMYFSSEGEEEMKRHQLQCGKGRIWDPFSEECRKLYCSTEFVLVDYRCVRKEAGEEEFNHENETSVIPDARAEFVHLTLTAEMEMFDILQFNGQDIETICETLRESLATSFSIKTERIRNVRFNISVGDFRGLNETLRFLEEMDEHHQIHFKIDFDLYEDNITNVALQEPSVDSIVSMLASSLSMNGFEFDINNVTSRIFEIHQTVTPLTYWCNSEMGGEKKEYWNSEFSLILNEGNSSQTNSQIKGIYVNKTGKFYPRGKFIADILFQGYQFSGNLINVSGVAVVCDWKKKLNESCIRILIESHEYTLKNGSLKIHNASLRNVVDDSIYEDAEKGSIWTCIKSFKTNPNNGRYYIELDIVQALISYIFLWISVVSMAIVLITYIAFESLRNLPGCNTMNLTFSLLAMQMTFIFGQRNTVTGIECSVVGHLLHYEILCSFMWMNVMAFDLFRTFGNRNVMSNIRSKRKYLPRYMAYAYLVPVTIIAISSLLDYYLSDSIFAPHYGVDNVCWINSKYSALVFFATPLAVIMCINFVFFVLTILAMRSVKSVLNLSNQKTNHRGKSDVLLYARMALVIGLTWTLSFAAAFTRNKLVGQVLTYLFIIFNTSQGVFIFWVFVCNKRVYDLYKEAFTDKIRKLYKEAQHKNTSGAISHLANVMKRTISTDTVVSTISNSSSSSNNSQLTTISEHAKELKH